MSETVRIHTIPTDGYAKFLGSNFDTVQECFQTEIPLGLEERLEEGQRTAQEKHEGQGTAFEWGGETFQIWSSGSKGNRWVIENADMQFHIRTAKPGWNISVRYLAPGLYKFGIDALKERAVALIKSECRPLDENWITLSRLDFCFDFHSPKFSMEQLPGLCARNLLLTSGVKAGTVFTSRRNETITIGLAKSAGLQIQIYDKGKELVDKPGKEWMYDIWAREGYQVPEEEGHKRARDVWRVEVRFGKAFLKDRNIRTLEAFREQIKALLDEALYRRRMVVPKIKGKRLKSGYRDKHKERWDFHPLWAAVYDQVGMADEYVPVGRIITMERAEYITMLQKQQAGLGRSLSMALVGCYDEDTHEEQAVHSVKIAVDDAKHENKIDKCMERMRFMGEPK